MVPIAVTTPNPSAMERLQAFVSDASFPCVGAKAALGLDTIVIVPAVDMRTDTSDARITAELQAFAARADDNSPFLSLAIVFEQTPPLSEGEFEAALWRRLQAIHDIDLQSHDWDPDVSSDPRSPDFGMSVGGHGFYVVGLHPGASRPARRFSQAMLVFNLHSQFLRLKEDGRYPKMQSMISARDIELCGSRNPMLAAHGVASEAPQYSGRVVGPQWVCPFHARPAKAAGYPVETS